MADHLTKEKRSWNMSQIRSKDTKPEIVVRSLLHRMGYRFRLHRKDLPGKPDIVLPKHKTVIFVHGCFWHMHNCSYGRVMPKTNAKFWQSKREENVERDKRNLGPLRKAGWKILTIWECETKDVKQLVDQIHARLSQ